MVKELFSNSLLHVTLPGSDVMLPGSKCNASRIQMKRFRDPGGTAKNSYCKISQELQGVGK